MNNSEYNTKTIISIINNFGFGEPFTAWDLHRKTSVIKQPK